MYSLRRATAAPSQAAALDYQDPQSQHPFHWHYSEFDDSNFQIRGRTLFFIVVLFAIILLITFVVLYARWDGDKVKSLPQCRHCFHSECVDKWLRTQSSCPLCRTSLRFDSPV
nr:RING-H2 finger protein ATL66 [Ipomoea trifida]GMD02097.1 RING-H2 finger protein ATL66-like [Ipomoea batatas]